MTLTPKITAPTRSLPLTGGGRIDDLALGSGADGRSTLVLFFRGLHCPVCREQLSKLDRRLEDLRDGGVGRVVAVSMASAERSAKVLDSWQLENLPLAHNLSEESARQWGLFISLARLPVATGRERSLATWPARPRTRRRSPCRQPDGRPQHG